MNERKLNPMLSYDKEQNKPKLINDEAILACVNYIKDGTKANVDFEVDDLFLNYMYESTGKRLVCDEEGLRYTQEEINDFVWKMVEECSEVEEELPSLGDIIKNKLEQN
tara:strand:- start:88 stop:414 length:327 start_codon:yes stop_codon:yes gene_type:complete